MGLEVLVHLVGLVTVYVRLGHQRKCDAVVKLAEAGDAIVILWFLATELKSRRYRCMPDGLSG